MWCSSSCPVLAFWVFSGAAFGSDVFVLVVLCLLWRRLLGMSTLPRCGFRWAGADWVSFPSWPPRSGGLSGPSFAGPRLRVAPCLPVFRVVFVTGRLQSPCCLLASSPAGVLSLVAVHLLAGATAVARSWGELRASPSLPWVFALRPRGGPAFSPFFGCRPSASPAFRMALRLLFVCGTPASSV